MEDYKTAPTKQRKKKQMEDYKTPTEKQSSEQQSTGEIRRCWSGGI